jgi:hypothetical protein
MKVSIFKNILDTKAPYDVQVSAVLKKFKTNDDYGIGNFKNLDPASLATAKKSLPAVCFGGTFSERSNSNLNEASGLMILDFDKLSDLNAYKERFKQDPYTYAFFESPSGHGLKMLVKIPIVKSDTEYKKYYYSFMARYKELDTSGKDISRLCFYCYDPDLYINDKSQIWKETHKDPEPKKLNLENFFANDYGAANKVLNYLRKAVPGERHTRILNASRLMGGYIASGKIAYEEAIRLLEQDAYILDPQDFKLNQKAILDGVSNGMQSPISDIQGLKKEIEISEKYGKIYYTLADKRESIDDLWVNGLQKGYDVGYPEADELYTVKTGCTTYIYGAPYSGKSQVWFQFLVNLSHKHGIRHAIFSPETGRAEEIFIELIEIYAQSDFYNTHGNKMTDAKRKAAEKFVDQYFIVIDPEKNVLNVEEFYEYCEIIERVYNVKIHTTTIDPWNELAHSFKEDGRQDLYLERILGFIREVAREKKWHNCIITHVQDQEIKSEKTESGAVKRYYPPASYREVAGGQSWSRKGMAMISVWRPPSFLKNEHGLPYEENESVIFIQKAKPKGIGKIGNFSLYYHAHKHGYSAQNMHVDNLYKNIKEVVKQEKYTDYPDEPAQKPYQLPIVPNNFDKPLNPPKSMEEILKEDVKAPW